MDEYDFGIIIPMISEFDVFRDVFETSDINQGMFEGPLREVHTTSEFSGLVHCVQEQGLMPAFSATGDLYEKIGPSLDLLLNIGIAGGLDNDEVKIGDVVSASHVYQIDRNEKYTSDVRSDESIRLPGPKPYDIENRFKSETKRFRGDREAVEEWSSNVKSQLDTFDLTSTDIAAEDSAPSIAVGPIASSGSVVADRGTTGDGMYGHIIDIDRNTLVVDQESVAVVEQVKRKNTKFGRHVIPGILRGVSDFADSDKGTDEAGRQKYAMYSAASLFKFLLESGRLNGIFDKIPPSEQIPSPITPPAIAQAQRIASTLRGRAEGRFGVLHRSLEQSLESLPDRFDERMSTSEMLFELMISFENQCLHSDIKATNGAASDAFSEALRDYRNMLYFLELALRDRVPNEGGETVELALLLSNAHLRLKILETTTTRGAVGGTAVDSFSRREWETKELWPERFGGGELVPSPTASQVVVLERFDSASTTKHYEIAMEALNGRVAVEEGKSATKQCEIAEGGSTSVSFDITEADSNERRRHRIDESQYPWGDMDILQIDIYAGSIPLSDIHEDIQEADEQWLVNQNIEHSTLHTALPGVDQEEGGISVPVIR